jgi:hypothetical protein
VRVEITESAGSLLVEATMAGAFAREFGKGDLRRSIAALVLRPESGKPAVVAVEGAGRQQETGARGAGRPIAVFAHGRTLGFVFDYDASRLDSLEVKTFDLLPAASGSRAGASAISKKKLKKIAKSRAKDKKKLSDAKLEVIQKPRGDECQRQRDLVARLREQLSLSHPVATPDEYRALEARIEAEEAKLPALCPPVTVTASHYITGGPFNDLCVDVATNPALPGAPGTLRVTFPSGFSGEQTITLDQNGHAFMRGPINEEGTYRVDAEVMRPDGTNASATTTHEVGAAQGTCGPP